MIVTAVVHCDARPDRPDPVALVDGRPMVARAVRTLLGSGLVDRVDVLVADRCADAVVRACRGLPVTTRLAGGAGSVGAHTDQRGPTPAGDGSDRIRPEIVVLHDAARPLAPSALVSAVVAAVRSGHPAAVPVLPMTDTVKRVDGAGLVAATPDRATLRVVQTPMALRSPPPPGPPAGVLRALLASGTAVRTVPGHPLAFPVRTAWDLELAELLASRQVAAQGEP